MIDEQGVPPFAAECPYIYVVRVKDMSKILDLGKNNYDIFKSVCEKLAAYPGGIKPEALQKIIDASLKKESNSAAIWYLTFQFSKALGRRKGVKASVQWNKVFRYLGIEGAWDHYGESIIHENEPTQAVFFSTQAFTPIDLIQNVTPVGPFTTREALYAHKPDALISDYNRGKFSYDDLKTKYEELKYKKHVITQKYAQIVASKKDWNELIEVVERATDCLTWFDFDAIPQNIWKSISHFNGYFDNGKFIALFEKGQFEKLVRILKLVKPEDAVEFLENRAKRPGVPDFVKDYARTLGIDVD